jgi:hypothetical protein
MSQRACEIFVHMCERKLLLFADAARLQFGFFRPFLRAFFLRVRASPRKNASRTKYSALHSG